MNPIRRIADVVGQGPGFRSSATNVVRRQRAMENIIANELGDFLQTADLPPDLRAAIQSGQPGAELRATQYLLRSGAPSRPSPSVELPMKPHAPTPAQLAAERELEEMAGPFFVSKLRAGQLTPRDIMRYAAEPDTPAAVQVDYRLNRVDSPPVTASNYDDLIKRLGLAAGGVAAGVGGIYGGQMLGRAMMGE